MSSNRIEVSETGSLRYKVSNDLMASLVLIYFCLCVLIVAVKSSLSPYGHVSRFAAYYNKLDTLPETSVVSFSSFEAEVLKLMKDSEEADVVSQAEIQLLCERFLESVKRRIISSFSSQVKRSKNPEALKERFLRSFQSEVSYNSSDLKEIMQSKYNVRLLFTVVCRLSKT